VPIELSESSSASSYVLPRNEELVLTLAENPTTGFRWEVLQSGAGALRLLGDAADAGSAVPGAGRRRVLRFVAQDPGSVELTLVLRRSWEPPEAALERRVFSIVAM
jgi:inhibitor of cysteine peptidase